MVSHLLVSVTQGVACITFNRPESMNAMSSQMLTQLEDAVTRLASDPLVRGVILTGSGERAFMAGGDISMLVDLDSIGADALSGRAQRVCHMMESSGKPFIAAVNGYAVGGGCELALACDFRICSQKAYFGLPEIKIGTIPGFGGTQRLPRLIGSGRALEMIMSGEPVDAETAYRIGLVNRVVEGDQLLSTAQSLIHACSRHSLAVLALAKQSLHCGMSLPLSEGLALERQLFAQSFSTEDRHEGMQAFLEKRAAHFTDR